MTQTQLHEPLLWRYATKKFDPKKKIPEKTLHELLEVLRLAPSSFGLQPWKFIVVKDPALRAKLREHAYGQPQLTDASEIVILAARKVIDDGYIRKFVESTAEARGVPAESLQGYEDSMIGAMKNLGPEKQLAWSQRQLYLPFGFLMYAAAQLKIDTCPMEGFDAAAFDKILGLKEYAATAICAIGYRSEDDKYALAAKSRFDTEEVVEVR